MKKPFEASPVVTIELDSPSAGSIELRNISNKDLSKIAGVHIRAFPDSALTQLGTRVVERYYQWQLMGPHENVRAVGAFVGTSCAGFAFSGIFKGSVSGFLSRNRVFLAKEVILNPWLLRTPQYRRRILSALRVLGRMAKKPRPTSLGESQISGPRSYGILAIAVSNNFRKLGIGKLLMEDAEQEALKLGYQRMHLSVNPENGVAVKFYEKQSWQRFLKDDKWDGQMFKLLD